jgi:sterol desaturase/sphingolipid hydroxylase (fatty acid hydroxylase superfamily)
MVYEILDAVVNVFSHANVTLPPKLDSMLRRVIVTPNLHRIHHSSYQPETDSNYGAVFPIWDRLMGTYVDVAPENWST